MRPERFAGKWKIYGKEVSMQGTQQNTIFMFVDFSPQCFWFYVFDRSFFLSPSLSGDNMNEAQAGCGLYLPFCFKTSLAVKTGREQMN